MESKKIATFWISFYLLIAIFELFFGVYLVENLWLIIILFLVRNKNPKAIFFVGLAGLFHVIGTIPHLDLYAAYTNYDLIVHGIGFFFATRGLLELIPEEKNSHLFLMLIGLASLMEIFEYLGFVLFGYGGGALQFGSGDANLQLGAWGDSITDMIANSLGVGLSLLLYGRKKE